jgi:phosphoribosyl 1,2-cyclic phosphodiesterase
VSGFVRFWGTRGSIPTPGPVSRRYGGNTSCVEIRAKGALFVCDGGTGLRELGLDLLERGLPSITGHLLFSHAHWDHIQGFPFFVPVYNPKNTFYVYGTSEGDRRLYDLLSGQMRSEYFPVDFSELRSRIVPADLGNGTKEIEGVEVSSFELTHPGRSFAFCFRCEGWKVVYATDNELDLCLPDPKLLGCDPSAARPLPAALVEFVRGADLLIADAQYTDEEYPSKVGWGHSRATSTVDLAIAAGVSQLALYHHDPMHSDQMVDQIASQCAQRAKSLGGELSVFAAREGMELRVG